MRWASFIAPRHLLMLLLKSQAARLKQNHSHTKVASASHFFSRNTNKHTHTHTSIKSIKSINNAVCSGHWWIFVDSLTWQKWWQQLGIWCVIWTALGHVNPLVQGVQGEGPLTYILVAGNPMNPIVKGLQLYHPTTIVDIIINHES